MNINHKALVKGTLSSDAFVMVNKKLALRLGFLEAGLLGELVSRHGLVESKYEFFEDGKNGDWFYYTQKTCEEQLGMKRTQYENAIKLLEKENIISHKRVGNPYRKYYLIHWDRIVELQNAAPPESGSSKPTTNNSEPKKAEKPHHDQYVGNLHTGLQETNILDCMKPTSFLTNNNNYIKPSNNKDSKPLTLSEEIYQLNLPLNLRKKLETFREQILGLNFDICELERFYNKFEWIKENCPKEEFDYLDQWDIESIIIYIFKNKIQVEKTTYGLLKEIAHSRLFYKKESALGSSTYDLQSHPFHYDWLNAEHPTS